MSSPPPPALKELMPDDLGTINVIKQQAYESGYNLLKYINEKEEYKNLQIASAESLTAGMIMSTLVDIPWLGAAKYGCFGVYDTDAKRTFIGVKTENVYTHKCAEEMAVGVLKNSNATLAIAVTGNAMPYKSDEKMLGEVFIGIAGYNANDKIIYMTNSINSCMETENELFKEKCKTWYEAMAKSKDTYPERPVTATISQEIRYYTTHKAFELCLEFITKNTLSIPAKITQRKEKNAKRKILPAAKYNFGGEGICKNSDRHCDKKGEKQEAMNNNKFTIRKGRKRTKRTKKTLIKHL